MKADVECIYEINNNILMANYAEDDQSLFVCADQQNIFFCKNLQSNPLQSIQSEKQITSIRYGLETNDFYVGTQIGIVQVWDLNKLKFTEIEGHQNNVKIIRNINESNFITGGFDTNININDKNQIKPIQIINGHKQEINDLLILTDKVRLVSASLDQTIKLWDLRKIDQPILTINHNWVPKKLNIIEESNQLIVSEEQSIQLWNIDNIQQKFNLEQQDTIQCVQYDLLKQNIYCATGQSLEIFNLNFELIDSIQFEWNEVYDMIYNEQQLKLLVKSKENQIQELLFQQENRQENEMGDSIPFSQLMKFDQCFYPNQSPEVLEKSLHYSDEEFECGETKNDIVTTQQFSISFSSLLNDQQNKERFYQLEQIQQINQNHSKIILVLNDRIKQLQPIINHYSNNEMKLCIDQIHKQNDLNVVQNSLYLLRTQQKIKIKEDEFVILIAKSTLLINSKYQHQVIEGLEFLKFSFESVKNYIQSNIKNTRLPQIKQQDKFQQKPKTIDKLIYQFQKLLQLPCIEKILKAKKQEDYVFQLIKQITTQIGTFLNKLQ